MNPVPCKISIYEHQTLQLTSPIITTSLLEEELYSNP